MFYITQLAHYQYSTFEYVTETINLSLKQICDCGWGQRTDYLSFWMVAVFVGVNQPRPDSISYSTVAAQKISWGSGQKCLLIRLFAPAAHSWRVFASELPVTEDCVSGRGGGWGKPTRCLTFLSGSVRLFQHHSAPAEALGCLNLSIWKRCCVAAV